MEASHCVNVEKRVAVYSWSSPVCARRAAQKSVAAPVWRTAVCGWGSRLPNKNSSDSSPETLRPHASSAVDPTNFLALAHAGMQSPLISTYHSSTALLHNIMFSIFFAAAIYSPTYPTTTPQTSKHHIMRHDNADATVMFVDAAHGCQRFRRVPPIWYSAGRRNLFCLSTGFDAPRATALDRTTVRRRRELRQPRLPAAHGFPYMHWQDIHLFATTSIFPSPHLRTTGADGPPAATC